MFRLTTDAKKFERALEKMADGALGKATARTLNALARGANIQQKVNVRKQMIVRTQYTLNSMKVYNASETKPINRQNSVVGSTSPYLVQHEKGGMIRNRGSRIPVPTNAVRGRDRRQKIPTRYKMNRLGDIVEGQKKKGVKGKYFRIDQGIFTRTGGKLKRVRSLVPSVKIKGTHWHTEAAKKYTNTSTISKIFVFEAGKIAKELGAS